MTIQEFATKYKEQNPQYRTMDDNELVNRVVSSYPQFKNNIDFGEISNIKKSEPIVVSSQNNQNMQEKPGFKDLIIGAGKGLATTAVNMGKLGAKGLNAIFGQSDKNKEDEQFSEDFKKNNLTASNTMQKIGFMGEQIAEFFIPGGASLKAGKAAEIAVKGGKVVKTLAKLGATSATEAGLALGQTAIQKGGIDKEAKTAGLVGAITPTALKAGGTLLKGAVKVGSEALGKTTGTSGEAIMQALKNPNVIKFARQAGKDYEGFQEEVLNETKNALKFLAEKRASIYQGELNKIKLNPTQLDNISSEVRSKVAGLLDYHDINIVPPSVEEIGKKLNTLDFSKSTLIEGQNIVEKALNDVMGWTDNSAAGFDKLKRRLGVYADQLLSRDKRQALSFVLDLKTTIDQGLKNNIKGYEKMTSGYREASGLIDEINKTFSLGNNKMKETALKKIMGSLKDNNENRQMLLDVLSKSGNTDLKAKVAGAQLSKVAPRGLSGVIAPLGAAGLAFLNPANIPAILSYAALTSPRAVGEIANILGRVSDQMIKANKFSPEIERAIRELIIKSNYAPDTSRQNNSQ